MKACLIQDIEALDFRVPGSLMTMVGAIVQAVMILFVPVYATPAVVLAILPVIIFYYFLLVWILSLFPLVLSVFIHNLLHVRMVVSPSSLPNLAPFKNRHLFVIENNKIFNLKMEKSLFLKTSSVEGYRWRGQYHSTVVYVLRAHSLRVS